MDFNTVDYILVFAGSFLAGVINTLAGNGSVITLSLLTDVLGMQAGMANATNRVGILFQTFGTATGFLKNKMLFWGKNTWLVISCMAGAVLGVYTAIRTSNEDFLIVFRYMMIVMLILVLIKPERWIKQHPDILHVNFWVQIPVFFLIGLYGGFIQMGVGIFMLAVMVLMSGYTLMQANALKTILVMFFTTLVLIIFQSHQMIHWETGIVMAAGQIIAGYLTARYLSKMEKINEWAYRLLVVVIVAAILSQFGLLG